MDNRVITSRSVTVINVPVQSVDFISDGTQLASGLRDVTINIWNAEKSGILILVHTVGHIGGRHSGTVYSMKSQLGTLSLLSKDSTVKFWRVGHDYALLQTLKGHTDYIISVDSSADRKKIALDSFDNTIRIWDKVPVLLHHTLVYTGTSSSF